MLLREPTVALEYNFILKLLKLKTLFDYKCKSAFKKEKRHLNTNICKLEPTRVPVISVLTHDDSV